MASVCVFCASATGIDDVLPRLAAEVGARIGERRPPAGLRRRPGVDDGRGGRRRPRARRAHRRRDPPAPGRTTRSPTPTPTSCWWSTPCASARPLMDAHADAFLVLPGGIGTLEEFFEVWTAGSLGMHPKPVIVLDPDGFYAPLWDFLRVAGRTRLRPAGGAGSGLHRVGERRGGVRADRSGAGLSGRRSTVVGPACQDLGHVAASATCCWPWWWPRCCSTAWWRCCRAGCR